MKDLKEAIINSDELSDKDHGICHVLSLWAIDYYDLYNCIECYDPLFEDVMDDILDYLYLVATEPDNDIGWVRLPIA